MVNLTIDGKEIQVPEGTTVLRAAEMAGIDIPTLCDHPELTPYGGCRLCVVEIEGAKALQPSCTLPVSENMIVKTDTERINQARKFVLTMIFSERNHFCPYCQVSGGDCELQNAAYGQDMTHWDLQPNWQQFPVDASHPYFILDHNRCILCRRCVRACAELVGNFTLAFEERGAKSFLVADLGVPLGESSCVSCGTCVQICPTGAIIDRESAYIGRETQVEHHKSICTGCSIGCGIDIQTRDNRLVRIEGDWDSPINSGVICEVGRFHPIEESRERILTPLHRKDDGLKAITWDESFSIIKEKINENKSKTNIALASTRLPVNDLYTIKEVFKDNLGFDYVSSTENGHKTKQARKYAAEVNKSFECELKDIADSDCVITLDTNLDDDHQVAGFFIKRILPAGCKLINIETNKSTFNNVTEHSYVINKKDYVEFINSFTAISKALDKADSADETKKLINIDPSKLGLKLENLIETVKIMKSSTNPIIVYGGYIADDENVFRTMITFAEQFKVISNEKSKIIGLKGGANSLAASQFLLDEEIDKNDKDLAFIFIADEDPSEKLLSQAEKAKYLVVCSSYFNKLTSKADIVLPVETWLENDGQYINLEGKIQNKSKAIESPENVKSITQTLSLLAKSLDCSINGKDWKNELNLSKMPVELSEL